MSGGVHGALAALLEVVASPVERRVLGKGLEKAFWFEVLRGENGHLLRDFVLRDGGAHRVSRAVGYFERHYKEEIDIQAVAHHAGMKAARPCMNTSSVRPVYLHAIRETDASA